jgi:hypothetical protein
MVVKRLMLINSTNNALKVCFAATLGKEPEVDLSFA